MQGEGERAAARHVHGARGAWRAADHGETLVEILVAVVVFSLVGGAIITGLYTAIQASVTQRRQASGQVLARDFAQALLTAPYVSCAPAGTYDAPIAAPAHDASWAIAVTAIDFWRSGTTPATFQPTCPVVSGAPTDPGLQRIQFTVSQRVGTTVKVTRRMTVLKRFDGAYPDPSPTTIPPGNQFCTITVSGPSTAGNVQDTWVNEFGAIWGGGSSNTNYASDTSMNMLYLAGTQRYSLIRFDLRPGITPCAEGGTLPAGRNVLSAYLRLYTWHIGGLPACGANSCWHVLEPITSAWNVSTVTWNTRPSTSIGAATGTLFEDGNGALSWKPRYQYASGANLTAQIRAAYTTCSTNQGDATCGGTNRGWMIKEACAITYGKACGDAFTGFQMRTSEWSDPTQRPALTLVIG